MEKILKVQLDEGAFEPLRAHPEDAGLDLRTPRGFTLFGRGTHVVDTGVHVDIENGWFGKIESKSGLNINHGIETAPGVIDSGYSGSIKVRLYNLTDDTYRFDAGDKVCQMVLIPCNTPPIEVVPRVEARGGRGDDGYGSSGR